MLVSIASSEDGTATTGLDHFSLLKSQLDQNLHIQIKRSFFQKNKYRRIVSTDMEIFAYRYYVASHSVIFSASLALYIWFAVSFGQDL